MLPREAIVRSGGRGAGGEREEGAEGEKEDDEKRGHRKIRSSKKYSRNDHIIRKERLKMGVNRLRRQPLQYSTRYAYIPTRLSKGSRAEEDPELQDTMSFGYVFGLPWTPSRKVPPKVVKSL